MSLLELEDVTASYGHAQVLHGVSLRVEPGGATGILGANGAGKTTTLRAISGMVKASGRITFDGQSVLGLRPEQVAKLGIAHVPEGRGTLSRLSVRDNLLVGAYGRRSSREVRSDVEHCFELFPQLASRSRMTAASLSGGEQQMLAVCRAFMAKPRLLLLDEASLGLAPSTARQVYDAITHLSHSAGLSMLVVEQNAALAFTLVERAIVLETGRNVIEGSSDELLGMDSVRQAYLGG